MGKTTKRTATVATAVVLTVGAGTAAFAYASGWFQGGGTATAATATIQNVTATITIPASSHLFPGKTINLTGDIVNPNEFKVKINGVSVTGVAATKGGSSNSACDAGAASLLAALTGPPLEINAGQTANNRTFGTLTMGQNAAAACAGSTITATLTFAGELVD